jgi:DNA (cytosine-5)-methyltransferase 1
MMGLPAGWVTDIVDSRAKALHILGNGVVPQQAAAAIAELTP